MILRSLLALGLAASGLVAAPMRAPAESPLPQNPLPQNPLPQNLLIERAPEGLRVEEGQVTRLYLAALGRGPDRAGFEYWVNGLVEGDTLDSMGGYFLSSAEFGQRFPQAAERSNQQEADAAFVELLYRNVLGRPSDQAGRRYWIGQLASGLERRHVLLAFSESPEMQVVTGTVLPLLPQFRSNILPVTASDLGSSWRSGCPVGPEQLARIEANYLGFDGAVHVGHLVVHQRVAADIVGVFSTLYDARYPIESLQTVDVYGGDDDASMAANNTSAFNCRSTVGGSGWSRHAYGLAVDLNPRQNPYRRGDVVLPPEAVDVLDRSSYHPAMIRRGDVVTTAFERIGWEWGGDWTTLVDYQHFDRSRLP